MKSIFLKLFGDSCLYVVPLIMKTSQGKTQPKCLIQPRFLDQPRFFIFYLPLFLLFHFVLKASTAYFSTAPNSHLHAIYAFLFLFLFLSIFFSPLQFIIYEPNKDNWRTFIPLNFYSLLSYPFY